MDVPLHSALGKLTPFRDEWRMGRANVPLAPIIGARKPMIHVAFALPLLFKSMERNKSPLDSTQKKISVRPDEYTLSNVRWSLSVSRHNYRSGSFSLFSG